MSVNGCGRDQKLPSYFTWSASHWLRGGGAAEAGMHRHCIGESFTWYAIAECLPIDYYGYLIMGIFLSSAADLWLFHNQLTPGNRDAIYPLGLLAFFFVMLEKNELLVVSLPK